MAVPPHRMTPIPLMTRGAHPPPHSFGADVRCIPCKILKNASRAVLSRWAHRPRSTGPDEVSELLGVLGNVIHQESFSETPTAPVRPKVDPRIHSSLGRRLLELLRSDVVE